MKTTKWFSIDDDGQPAHVGWWDVKYVNRRVRKFWWDGSCWRYSPGDLKTLFGNSSTQGEKYRGLAVKPKAKGE